MWKQKTIFLVIVASVVLLFAFLMLFLSNLSKPRVNWVIPKEFNVWVVWDETSWFSDIISAFKQRNKDYAKVDIKFTKFASYADYEKNLLNVMSDWNSPDVFVINNNSVNDKLEWLLESKIVWLPESVVSADYFEKNFNRAFDWLLIQNEEEKNWEKIKIDYIKWVPMWYETLGVFYNFMKIRNIPSTWAELDEEITNSEKENYATIWIWLGSKYVLQAADILTMMMMQNSATSYSDMVTSWWKRSLSAYLSYFSDENNWLSVLYDEMSKLWLTTVDMFVRWKVGMVIWYPSLLREIDLAVKRTWWTPALNSRYLRVTAVPQISSVKWDSKTVWKVNIINYNFFALSKYSKYPELWYAFLKFLSTKEAQEKYLKAFPYYLPALKSLEDTRYEENLEEEYTKVKYKDFIQDDVEYRSFDKWLKNEYDDYFWKNLDYSSWASDSTEILKWARDYIECNVAHMIKMSDFEKECK